MRTITKTSVNAFEKLQTFKRSNTEVAIVDPGIASFYLFGYCIATYNTNKKYLFITDAGRQTNTTKERLNGILRAFGLGSIFQSKGVWYFEDSTGKKEKFEGSKKFVF